LRASIPDELTGTLDIRVSLSDQPGAEPGALVALLSTWARAVEIGLFGAGRVRRRGEIETRGHEVSTSFECDSVARVAFGALSRMIRRFSKVNGLVERTSLILDRQDMELERSVSRSIPPLPLSMPFEVEEPEDLKRYVRIEIEFRPELTPSQRDVIFDALGVWDVVVQALGDEERWTDRVDFDTRLLSPAIVEHQMDGYFAGVEGLQLIVLLGLRLHQSLTIDRITLE